MKKFLNYIICILIIMILYSGSSSIRYYSNFAIIFLPIITLLSQFIDKDKNISFCIKNTSIQLAFILLFYFLISTIYTYNLSYSIEYIIKFACILLTILFCNHDSNFWKSFIKIIYISSLIVSISIIITIITPDFFLNHFTFLLPTGIDSYKTYIYELNNNIYSGILFERAFSAFALNLGIIAILAEYFATNKISKFKFISLILMVIALCCTGKRMLFLIFILILFIFIIFNLNKKYVKKYIQIIPIVVLILTIIFTLVPNTTTVFERFTNNDKNNNTIDSRSDEFWTYTFKMFNEKPMLGYGINTFIPYIKNFRTTSIYNAHNIYFQILGETGIIGFLIFSSLLISNIIHTLKLLKKYKNTSIKEILNFSLGIQILLILYGITGNTLYEFSQITIYLLTIAINCNIEKENKNE